MIHLAIALLFATGAEPEAARCVLSGRLSLEKPGGGSADPQGHTVVFVKSVRPGSWPRGAKTHDIIQRGRQFSPRLLVVMKGDSVKFENQDNEQHSVFSNSDTMTFDLPRSTKGVTGTESFIERGPVLVQCDIHGQMRADVLVVENPFFDLPDAAGAWRIQPLEPGDYELHAWETNGAELKKSVHCMGPTEVTFPTLKQATEPKLRHKDGSEYEKKY